MQRSPSLRLRANGPLACFTRPELKSERVSYPIMTPSAARGILEAILWKPAILWQVERIHVLREIEFTSFRRNEVNTVAITPPRAVVENGGEAPKFFADEDRAQRNTVALKNVDYLIEAHFRLTEKAGPSDNVNKFLDMFDRRLKKGQHFHQPYLGCREFAACITPGDDAPYPIKVTKDLGLMLKDIQYRKSGNISMFFAARLTDGILDIPENLPEMPLSTNGRAAL